jgi:serine/threonine protein kinase
MFCGIGNQMNVDTARSSALDAPSLRINPMEIDPSEVKPSRISLDCGRGLRLPVYFPSSPKHTKEKTDQLFTEAMSPEIHPIHYVNPSLLGKDLKNILKIHIKNPKAKKAIHSLIQTKHISLIDQLSLQFLPNKNVDNVIAFRKQKNEDISHTVRFILDRNYCENIEITIKTLALGGEKVVKLVIFIKKDSIELLCRSRNKIEMIWDCCCLDQIYPQFISTDIFFTQELIKKGVNFLLPVRETIRKKKYGYFSTQYLRKLCPFDNFEVYLERNLRNNPFDKRALLIFLGSVYSLHQMHSLQYVHRDYKFLNILVDDNESPRLIDFGKIALLNSPNSPSKNSIEGTPGYMAPEYYDPKECFLSPALDMFAVGASLLYIIQKELPFYTMQNAYPLQSGISTESSVAHEQPKALLHKKLLQKIKETQKKLRRSQTEAPQKKDIKKLIADLIAVRPSKRPKAQEVIDRILKIFPALKDPFSQLLAEEAERTKQISLTM